MAQRGTAGNRRSSIRALPSTPSAGVLAPAATARPITSSVHRQAIFIQGCYPDLAIVVAVPRVSFDVVLPLPVIVFKNPFDVLWRKPSVVEPAEPPNLSATSITVARNEYILCFQKKLPLQQRVEVASELLHLVFVARTAIRPGSPLALAAVAPPSIFWFGAKVPGNSYI